MTFYILTPHKIEAVNDNLSDFIADDLMLAIQKASTKIATDRFYLEVLQREYPTYHKYEIKIGEI
jgi:hypothetical protein